MITRWALSILILLASCGVMANDSTSPLKIVTTFSVLADMVKQVGGEYVQVNTLVDWDEDAHVYHPSPLEVRHLSHADMLVMNGLGFDGWLERLIIASKFSGKLVIATSGIDAIALEDGDGHDHGDQPEHALEAMHEHDDFEHQGYDPHAWHSLLAANTYIANILSSLVEVDPAHRSQYEHNAQLYLAELNALAAETRIKMARLSDHQRHIVIPHNAFAYLARDYDLHILSLKGISTEAEASAAQIARVVRDIKTQNIKAVFSETTSDDRLIKLVQQETDTIMGGALISGALSRKLAPAYLDMMRYNIDKIISALNSSASDT